MQMARLTSDENYEKCHNALELAGYARSGMDPAGSGRGGALL